VSGGGDIFAFKVALERQIAGLLGAEEKAELWTMAQSLLVELQELRTGARPETLSEARRVASLDDKLREMAADERLAAIRTATGYSRAHVFYLRKLARSLNQSKTASPVSN
jgi:hypothetical protein